VRASAARARAQDLETDLRHMVAEIELTTRESRGGEQRASEELAKIARKEKALANRLQLLVEKSNALEAANAAQIDGVNDLRSERALVLAQVRRKLEMDAKMDDDMAFLSQAAHAALDAREKVKVRIAQRERERAARRGCGRACAAMRGLGAGSPLPCARDRPSACCSFGAHT
jgi:hypothetical protein